MAGEGGGGREKEMEGGRVMKAAASGRSSKGRVITGGRVVATCLDLAWSQSRSRSLLTTQGPSLQIPGPVCHRLAF